MADPLSATANAAAIVGLVDVVCRMGKELYVFFAAVKGASQEIKDLQVELQDLETIFSTIRDYCESFSNSPFATADYLVLPNIVITLGSVREEYNILQGIVDTAKWKAQQRTKNLANKIKWVLNEKRILSLESLHVLILVKDLLYLGL